MPRQRIHHNTISTISRDFPADFPQRLKRFKEESRLPWAEIARLLGVYPHTVWRWQSGVAQPNGEHMIALLDLADDFGLGRLFID